MAKDSLTDAQVEVEIERLTQSENVKLAKKEQRLLYRRRQCLYSLRVLEKRGRELSKKGITFNNIEAVLFPENIEDLD